jgi:carbonic anhydrase
MCYADEFATLPAMAFTSHASPDITADQALRRLIEGNRRFLRGQARFPTMRKEILAELAREQRPYATILGCSDSRVPPELLFDASFGELFVIRVAGNTVSPEIYGSMQYAGVHLQTPLFVVLGHEGCGAVAAAMESRLHGARHHSRIEALVSKIVPAVRSVSAKLPPNRRLSDAVEANVRWVMKRINQTPEVKARRAEGQMMLVGAVYALRTGRVKFLK